MVLRRRLRKTRRTGFRTNSEAVPAPRQPAVPCYAGAVKKTAQHAQGPLTGSDRVEPDQVVSELQPHAPGGGLPVLGDDDFGNVPGVLLSRLGLGPLLLGRVQVLPVEEATMPASCSMEPLSLRSESCGRWLGRFSTIRLN